MIVFTFLIFFIVRSVHSETMNDLIWEKGIYYKKNTNIPFSGEINGNIKGKIQDGKKEGTWVRYYSCLLYTSPSPRDRTRSRMPSSA